jgi:N-acetylglucosamine kinase-like BadF-type ATPase
MSGSQPTPIVVAVDGGQSSTLALVAEGSGRILGIGWGGPSNHIHEPGGVERLQSALHNSITEALHNAGHIVEQVNYVCLGLSGVSPIAGQFTRELLPSAEILLHHDAVTALAGASVGQPGVIVIAGTGAVAYGERTDGVTARTSGWGYIMGDEGSAYDIGCGALRAAAQASDGRGRTTALLDRIPPHFGREDLRAVHRGIYSNQITRPEIAGLTRVVSEAAQAGDDVALHLLKTAGEHLAIAAAAVLEKLEMLEKGMGVHTTGGVFLAGEGVLASFKSALHARSPNSTVREAAFSPIIGGLLLALRAAGTALDDHILQTIQTTLPPAAISKQAARNN